MVRITNIVTEKQVDARLAPFAKETVVALSTIKTLVTKFGIICPRYVDRCFTVLYEPTVVTIFIILRRKNEVTVLVIRAHIGVIAIDTPHIQDSRPRNFFAERFHLVKK